MKLGNGRDIHWLLMSAETNALPRFAGSDGPEYDRLMKMKDIWRVSDEEQRTIEYRELEIPAAARIRREANQDVSNARAGHRGSRRRQQATSP